MEEINQLNLLKIVNSFKIMITRHQLVFVKVHLSLPTIGGNSRVCKIIKLLLKYQIALFTKSYEKDYIK